MATNSPSVVEAGSDVAGSWPRAGLTRLDYRNPHLAYALTWYAMALGLALALVYVVRLELGERRR